MWSAPDPVVAPIQLGAAIVKPTERTIHHMKPAVFLDVHGVISHKGKPAVFLDVDGVVNDLNYGHDMIQSHGYTLSIPKYMPELIQILVEIADVWWLTTWRERANEEIATHLGIEPLQVITDGTRIRQVGWKAEAAAPIATRLIDEGREVFWIEDFGNFGGPPTNEMPPSVVYIDTAAEFGKSVLEPRDLPMRLING